MEEIPSRVEYISDDLDDRLEAPVIESQDQAQGSWKLAPIYYRSPNGKVYVWQVGFDEEEEHLIILRGTLGGKKVLTTNQVIVNKSGRDLQSQAFLEAQSRHKKKVSAGYIDEGRFEAFLSRPKDESSDSATRSTNWVKPMLLNEYWPGGYDPVKKKNRKATITNFPVAYQVKIDGVRALIWKDLEKGIQIYSRTGHSLIHTPDHYQTLIHDVEPLLDLLPEGTRLDGELCLFVEVNGGAGRFQELTSIVGNKKHFHPDLDLVNYYIFDLILVQDVPFEQRYQLLDRAFEKYTTQGNSSKIIQLLVYELIYSHQEIAEKLSEFVAQGLEGMVLRKITAPGVPVKDTLYRSTRCNNIQKVKKFITEEAEIIDVTQGEGTEEGLAIPTVRDIRGNVLRIQPLGDHEYRRKMWQDREQLVSKMVTIKYFELTDDKVPRFPKIVAVRDYE